MDLQNIDSYFGSSILVNSVPVTIGAKIAAMVAEGRQVGYYEKNKREADEETGQWKNLQSKHTIILTFCHDCGIINRTIRY